MSINFPAFFAIKSNLIYLNSGTHSLCPTSVCEAVVRETRDYEFNPTQGVFRSWARLWKIQKRLAAHFKADPAQIVLRANVTQLLNEFILGCRLTPQQALLTTNQEYGAIFNICQFRTRQEGRKLKTVNLSLQSTPAEILESFTAALTPEVGCVIVSEIMTGTGLQTPIRELAKLTRSRGIVLIVDGAHGPGALELDFQKFQDVDFYAGNLHKWWMGPKGTAFGWVHPDREKDLELRQIGWSSFETLEPFDAFGDGDRFAQRQLMLGCQDFAPFFGIDATLDFWDAHGAQTIFQTRQELTHALQSLMSTQLPQLRQIRQQTQNSPLLTYEMPQLWQGRSSYQVMEEILEKTQVQVATTTVNDKMCLRLAPHIWNSHAELEKATESLKRYFSIVRE